MNSKLIVLFLLLSIIFPAANSYSPSEWETPAKLQCAKYSKEECSFNHATIYDEKIDCWWNQELNLCSMVFYYNSYNKISEKHSFYILLQYFVFFVLLYILPFLLVLKFGKSKILKNVYGIKVGLIVLFFLIFLTGILPNFYFFRFSMLVLFIELVLSLYAFSKRIGEPKKITATIAAYLLFETLLFLIFLVAITSLDFL